jgi:hypothetical protein
MPEPISVHPRLAKARDALAYRGLHPIYEAKARHPLGLLRLEVWAAGTELWLLRSLEAEGILALRLFTLESIELSFETAAGPASGTLLPTLLVSEGGRPQGNPAGAQSAALPARPAPSDPGAGPGAILKTLGDLR